MWVDRPSAAIHGWCKRQFAVWLFGLLLHQDALRSMLLSWAASLHSCVIEGMVLARLCPLGLGVARGAERNGPAPGALQ